MLFGVLDKKDNKNLQKKEVEKPKRPLSLRSSDRVKYYITRYTQLFYTIFATICVLMFAFWWFRLDHIPNNFTGIARVVDVTLFLLVSYIIWHPIIMEVLTWSISSHIKKIRHQKPPPNLKVAFITTIVPQNESLDLLHKCLPNMVKAKYPHDTWLLDEGDDPQVKKICDSYGVKHFSRANMENFVTPTGKFTKTKGGNHNAWYEIHGNNYDVVAQIDTDFVPKRTFLTKTLGYFKDSRVAFVGTPQIYGNTNDSLVAQGAAEQLYTFYGSILRGLSSIQTTLLIGANHVIRVSALKDINHYSAHITEDLITGMKLHSKGWKSIYLSCPLAVGEGPSTWEAYFNQQMRWAYGCMDIFFKKSHKITKQMGFLRSIYYFFLQQHYFAGVAMAISTILLSLYFFTGLRAADIDLLRFLVFYSFVILITWLMSVWLQRYNVYQKSGGELLLAGKLISIAAWPIWLLAFICIVTGKKISYKVTPKGESETPKTSFKIFIPHITIGIIALSGAISSIFTGRQSAIMLFWAISAASVMLTLPFAESIYSNLLRLKTHLIRLTRKTVEFFQKLQSLVNTKVLRHKSSSLALTPLTAFIAESKAMRKERSRYYTHTFMDIIFLSSIVFMSLVLHINSIGFYSDDWSFLGNFALSKDQSLIGLIETAFTPNTLMRPVQNIYDALLYWAFGTNPLGYQIVNSVVLTTITILFYLVLRKLNFPRTLSIAVPVVFALLPHYSTDRFWFAAFQVNLSVMLYFFSLYFALRSTSPTVVWESGWKTLSIVFLILSSMSYEVVVPLYVLNIAILWSPIKNYFKRGYSRAKRIKPPIIFTIVLLIALFYIFVFKLITTIRLGGPHGVEYIMGVIAASIHTNYVLLGINLPKIWGQAISMYTTPSMLALGGVLYITIFLYLYSIITKKYEVFPSKAWLFGLTLISVVVFFLGYSIFFTNSQVGFSATGIDNRVAIAASIGIAFSLVGLTGWLTKLLLPDRIARLAFCVGVSTICLGSYLTVNSIASFWGKAYTESNIILTDIHNKFPDMAKNTTFILDGICPYVGPAPVFEAQWDLKGAMQLHYKDPSLRADVVTPRMKITEDGLLTQIYGFKTEYPYKNLVIYNYDYKEVHKVSNEKEAQNYFQKYNPDLGSGCPNATPGKGVSIFAEVI